MTGGYPPALQAVLLIILLLATCVWIGGWATLIVVARTATAALSRADRVSFFRLFGRRFGIVSTIALVLALASGLLLLVAMPWTALSTWMVVLAVVLLLVVGAGVVQARMLTRQRRALIAAHDEGLEARIAAGARAATVLRASLGAISIVILMLAVLPR
ncbi:hypothetical protein GCM10022240_01210 [Microbacterium kribbense]|uniref:DUF2269 family protein n=1 Tax=Microbacterium kribbense TaxID=433645 RepID=A0ABP7FZJ9_9MICO